MKRQLKIRVCSTHNTDRRECYASINKELVLDGKKKTVFPSVSKIEFVGPKLPEKPVKKPVKYAEMYRSQKPRGNKRNWNNQKSQQLGRSTGGRGRRTREGDDEHVDELNGQGNDQGIGANEGIEGANRNVEGANGGTLNFLIIIA
ncbi:hypothetical protein Tco_0156306 [Tanacetum coccineum]